MATLSYLFLAAFLFRAVLIPTSCRAINEQPQRKAALFIFGDSVLDAGNNNYINTSISQQANFWPYGGTFFKLPTGRFSDGRLIGDFIAQYANLQLIPPFLQPGVEYYNGVNFASGGAGALSETFQEDQVISLKTQLSNYKKVKDWLTQKLGDGEANMTISNAVHLLSIGANDYFTFILRNPAASKAEQVRKVIGNLTMVIEEIYSLGGRKFGFVNVPPVGCFPGVRIFDPENRGSCFKDLELLAKLHNEALPNHLVELQKKLEGFKYSLFDLNTAIQQRIDHPTKYGFKRGKRACCGSGQFGGVGSCGGMGEVKEFSLCANPEEHVFWDAFHLTETSYKQFADQMWNGLVNGPYSVKKLFHLDATELETLTSAIVFSS